MNASNLGKSSGGEPSGTPEAARSSALLLFPLKDIHHLDSDSAVRCQKLLGHGDTLGTWVSPKEWMARRANSVLNINIRERLIYFLPDTIKMRVRAAQSSPAELSVSGQNSLLTILDEAVLWMTRYALLCRMGPAFTGRKNKDLPLKVSTTATLLNQYLPPLMALAVERRLNGNSELLKEHQFINMLQPEDLNRLSEDQKKAVEREFVRLQKFRDLKLWQDAPVKLDFKGRTTNVKGEERQRPRQNKNLQFQPLPDDYVAEMGGRCCGSFRILGLTSFIFLNLFL